MGLTERLRRAVAPLDTPDLPAPGRRRTAAVLLLADPADAALPMLFMLRTELVSHHRGQIGFPGGAAEPHDLSAGDTALRETAEEMGIAPESVELIGKLPAMLTAVSHRWLTPVVGLLRHPVEIVADPFEVAEWFHVTLADLLDAPHRVERVDHEGVERSIHYYSIDGRVIWGVTGAIVHDLLARLGRTD